MNEIIHLNHSNVNFFQNKKTWDDIESSSKTRDDFNIFKNPRDVKSDFNYDIIDSDFNKFQFDNWNLNKFYFVYIDTKSNFRSKNSLKNKRKMLTFNIFKPLFI